MEIEIRVRPNASRNQVGGTAGDPPRLIVAVQAPAVDGKANAAVRKEVAKAFGIKAREVSILRGETSRDKRILVTGDESLINARLNELSNQ